MHFWSDTEKILKTKLKLLQLFQQTKSTKSHYNPSVRIIDLASHTTYVVCVNFIHKWRALQFNVDSQRQIFWETFHGNFIYSQSLCWEDIAEEILFVFCFDVWPGARTLSLRRLRGTHFILLPQVLITTFLVITNLKTLDYINNHFDLFEPIPGYVTIISFLLISAYTTLHMFIYIVYIYRNNCY